MRLDDGLCVATKEGCELSSVCAEKHRCVAKKGRCVFDALTCENDQRCFDLLTQCLGECPDNMVCTFDGVDCMRRLKWSPGG